MSIVIEQTLPYTTAQLGLEHPDRWARLFPLLRPSIQVIESSNGNPIVINTLHTKSKDVLLCVIGCTGNFSSKIFNEPKLTAFAVDTTKNITPSEVSQLLQTNGFPVDNGIVIVKAGSIQRTKVDGRIVEIEVVGELQMDHILSLLSAATSQGRLSVEKVQLLLQHFVKSVTKTVSKFHEKKSGNSPFVFHASEGLEFNSAKAAIQKDLSGVLGSNGSTEGVYSIHYADINGLSRLENNILAHEISEYCASKNLKSYITQSTITDQDSQARGWAISLCPIPFNLLTPQSRPSNSLSTITTTNTATRKPITSTLTFTDAQIRQVITSGCEALIHSEPIITEYDTIVGDGDCGYTLRDGAKQVLSFLSSTPSLLPFPEILSNLVDDLEVNMGGTSGALYCIFLSSLSQQLYEAESVSAATKGALEHLLRFTKARKGDRTCLDCLIPFVENWVERDDLEGAMKEARKGVKGTEEMQANLGRSSYLDEGVTRGVPDPGAYGLLVLLEGMIKGV